VLFSSGLLWVGAGWNNPERWILILGGVALIVAFFAWERRRQSERSDAVHVERRPVTIALFVGLVIAMAQIVPMSQLPIYFGILLRQGPTLGMVAMAPLFVALVLAGPIAGFLLARFEPRALVAGGVIAIGLGDILVAAAIGPTTTYLVFVLPLILVGAGFVVATTVRTAIIFSSVPRGLPATAAALNEASIEVGTRAGIVAVTGLLAEVALSTYAASLVGKSQSEADTLVTTFKGVLTALGTPAFQTIAIPPGQVDEYKVAYFAGLQVVLLAGGAIALAGGVIAWFTLGRRNPLQTVYELRDERTAATG
jgi:hypothetical protein